MVWGLIWNSSGLGECACAAVLIDPRKSVEDGVRGRVARWCRVSHGIGLVLGNVLALLCWLTQESQRPREHRLRAAER
jgi:hypothetical protein